MTVFTIIGCCGANGQAANADGKTASPITAALATFKVLAAQNGCFTMV